jgi:Ser/Thr protein kinase RdoA (MazF antagonist)
MAPKAVYSTISAASIAETVDQNYDIGLTARCQFFTHGVSDFYELEGGDGRPYLARLCSHRSRGPANIDYETALLAHLDRCGIVVGAPVVDREARLWSLLDAPEGPRAFTVLKRLQGRTPRSDLNRTGVADVRTLAGIEALGASMGQIHLAGASYAGPPSLYRIDEQHLIEKPLAQIVAVVDDAMAQDAKAIGESLAKRLAERAPSLSIGHCHGDNHGGNTLIADGMDGAPIAGWFDFDDAGPGFLAYDLATFLWAELNLARSDSLSEARQSLWAAFITGYRSVRQISEADFDAIGFFVAIRHVWLMGLYAGRIPEWGAKFVSADWFRDGFTLLRKWNGLAAPAVG